MDRYLIRLYFSQVKLDFRGHSLLHRAENRLTIGTPITNKLGKHYNDIKSGRLINLRIINGFSARLSKYSVFAIKFNASDK